MKRILLVLSMLTCLCLLAACGSTTTDSGVASSSSGITEDQYQSYAEQLLSQITEMDDETLDGYITGGQISEGLVSGLSSWQELKEELGSLDSITNTEVTMGDDSVIVTVTAKFSKRNGTYTLVLDEDDNVTSSSFDKVYTTKEIFKKAVLNTLMGMGTVFVVLIFISFIISLFKYIPDIQAKFTKKAEQTTEIAAPAEPVAAPEEDLVDDGELVAVITAAVCAAMAAEGNAVSKDGLVVRSIRRSRK